MGSIRNEPNTEYFLSCYITPPGKASIFVPRHDQSIAAWRVTGQSVELLRLWELERLSGQKHHYWPIFSHGRLQGFLQDLLSEISLTLGDINKIWGLPGFPQSEYVLQPPEALDYPIHSLSHLFGGLLLDTNTFRGEIIVAIAADGSPDSPLNAKGNRYWYAGCASVYGKLKFFPIRSPAPLYGAAKRVLGREPGTLMALASACSTSVTLDVEQAVSGLNLYGGRETPLLTAIPFVSEIVKEVQSVLGGKVLSADFTREEHIQSATMKIVQQVCDDISVQNVETICQGAGIDPENAYLSTSGGYALNCPTNSLLMNTFQFKGLQSPPCANDSGQAFGLGLMGLYNAGYFDSRGFRLGSAYYGAEIRDLDEALNEYSEHVEGIKPFDINQFVKDIITQPVAWAAGNGELGPRALGHRSLLGDPRTSTTKDLLNSWKGREWWRPVAPIVLEEDAGNWFTPTRRSPYMLEVAEVLPSVRSRVPAIVHLDGTARHQTLQEVDSPLLYSAIAGFKRETGVPLLCNTSLNDKGEPIVCTAKEVLNFCIRKGISVSYIDGHRVQIRPLGGKVPTGPARRRTSFFAGQEIERDEIWNWWLKKGYSESALYLLSCSPELRDAALAGLDPGDVNGLADYKRSVDHAFSLFSQYFIDGYGPKARFNVGQSLEMEE